MVTKVFKLALVLLLSSCAYKQNNADALIYNGNIFVHGSADSKVQALMVKDGKVIDYGPKEEMRNLYRYQSEINLKGKTLYPYVNRLCFNDSVDSRPEKGFKNIVFKDTVLMGLNQKVQYAQVGNKKVYYSPQYTLRHPYDYPFLCDTIISIPANGAFVAMLSFSGLSYQDKHWDYKKQIQLGDALFWEQGVDFLPKFAKSNIWGLDKGCNADFFILNQKPFDIAPSSPLEIHEVYKNGVLIYNFLFE